MKFLTWKDDAYLLDMLIAARRIRKFTEGMSKQAFLESDLHKYAIERLISILGEAATRVTPETQAAHPTLDWRQIIGMRNRLVHRYEDVDMEIVWDVIVNHVPELIVELEAIVPPDEPEQNDKTESE